jgi:hypothetical protein
MIDPMTASERGGSGRRYSPMSADSRFGKRHWVLFQIDRFSTGGEADNFPNISPRR